MEFYAKSNPRETIQEHTNNLMKNFELLKSIYPNLNVDWGVLRLACLYHDLGKINKKFQKKLLSGKKEIDEIPHSILSLAFIDFIKLEEEGMEEIDIKVLYQSIAYHHDRDLNFSDADVEREISLMKSDVSRFYYSRLDNLILNDYIEDMYYSVNDRIYSADESSFYKYVMLKGLLNKLDYAASSYIPIEIRNDFLMDNLEKFRCRNNYSWNDLQSFMLNNQDNNVISVAQTGMGKTEAGLLWIGDNKGFFTLPLKTAINEIFKRVTQEIVDDEYKNHIGLLHSETYDKYLEIGEEHQNTQEYYNQTKQLSLPLTICTLDQLFDMVYRYRNFELKLATLSYSKTVIDEVQMYSPDLLANLIMGIKLVTKAGGKFAILTATLPIIIEELLIEADIKFVKPDKPFINNQKRHNIKVIDDQINDFDIKKRYKNNKILVICNTVKKAKELYKLLVDDELFVDRCQNINLFHSKFIKKDRKQKEKEIVALGKFNNNNSGIWVTTQVVEASLDIDFDFLMTELSDACGLFQRMGRCNRNGKKDIAEHNCYVYTGGSQPCSGVGDSSNSVIDEKIFELSKNKILTFEGIISEQEKINSIDEIYTTKVLENTNYYKNLKKTLQYVSDTNEYELSSSEVKKIFRNIHTITVIPKSVYYDNITKINNALDVLAMSIDYSLSLEHIWRNKEDKIRARNDLLELTLDVYYYEYENAMKSQLIEGDVRISQYRTIPIIDYDYTFDIGLSKKNQ